MVFKVTFDKNYNAVYAEPYPELDITSDLSLPDGIGGSFYIDAGNEAEAMVMAKRLKKKEA